MEESLQFGNDHYAQEYTLKGKFTYTPNKIAQASGGWEHAFTEYQWVDVFRPWVGAPIVLNDSTTTPSISIGSSNDIWKVNPQKGGFFVQDRIGIPRNQGYVGNAFELLGTWCFC